MRTRSLWWTVLFLCVLLLIAARSAAQQSGAAQPSGTEQHPAFRSGVELVMVDVGVVGKDGRPIRDLRAADFTVTVAGRPRRVVTAEFIDVAAEAEPGARAGVVPVSTNEGPGAGRLFLFVVDSHTLEIGDARHVADAATRFLSRLTPSDRSALVSLPIGQNVPFTWAHDRVRQALLQAASAGSMPVGWEFGSLSEARDIATRGPYALGEVAARECSSSIFASGSSGASPGPSSSSGGGSSGGGDGSRTGGTSGQQTSRVAGSGFGEVADRCYREIQTQAELTWNMARTTSMASVAALRDMLATLGRIQGDKSVVLISGGWPMDDHDQTSVVSALAADAGSARVRLFTIYVPRPMMGASRRSINLTARNDQSLYLWPLETLAARTGGESFRADASAEGIFERLSRELAGYYRIGVEKDAADAGANGRHMKVQIARGGTTVRARQFFDVTTYEDRDWAARLASALASPVPATALGLRVTSYLAPDEDDASHVRLLLAGSASRLQPGEATMQLVVRDLDGRRIMAGEQRIGEPKGSDATFIANVRVAPGAYVVRIAVQDGAGRVGSVDHRVDARPVSLGALSITGPLLVQVPATGQGDPRFTLDAVQPDERLALEVGIEGDRAQPAAADVTFEIAASADGPPLIQRPASVVPGRHDGSLLAQAVVDLRVLPPGRYLARARVRSGTTQGEVRRAFAVLARSAPAAGEAAAGTGAGTTVLGGSGTLAAAGNRGRAATLPPFAVRQVLSPQVLRGFLDRVAARPDAAFPGVGDLLGRVRTENIAALNVSEAQAAQTPVAAFVRGLSLLAQNKLNPAAAAFRSAMRASPDLYQAMVYLGACYAAGGNDKEAAAIWRTALIREADAPALHLLLADALLRQGNGAVALQVVNAARTRWPDDQTFTQRFVIASLIAGDLAAGLQALDGLVERRAADEPALALALQVVYESLTTGRTIESPDADRARLLRFADAYRSSGGPLLALVETWVAAVKAGEGSKPR